MAGHSKWKNIQARKGKQDAKRGKIFTKLGRELNVAVKQGGADPETNATLASVIAKAKANNMPNDTIESAIKRASGATNTENYDEIIYEGYAPNGVAVIVEAMTDNKNRTASEVRHIFSKGGGNLGTSGSVSYMFDRKGQVVINKKIKEGKNEIEIQEDELLEKAIENGAEDLKTFDEVYEIITDPKDFTTVIKWLETEKYEVLEAGIVRIPQTTVLLNEEKYEKIEKIIGLLEDLDDVQNVYHNANEE